MLILHAQIDVINPADSSTVSLRLTNINESFATVLGGNSWLPVLHSIDELQMRFFSGDFSGETAVQSGGLTVRSTPALNDTWATYVFDGARLQVWATNVQGTAPSNSTKVFDGLAGQTSRGLDEYRIEMKSPAAIASNPVQTSVYAGTGGAEGPIEMKGNIKPYGIGSCTNVAPILVNASKQIYHVSTAAYAMGGVFENGVGFNFSGTSFTTYAAMDAAASPGTGNYTYCIDAALGLFIRLGAEPAGLITCDFQGDLSPTAYAGTAAKKLLDLAGMPSWRYDSSRITAFNTAVSNVTVNRYFSTEQSVEDAISEIMQGVGGYYGFDELGVLFMGLTRIGSSSATLSHARDAVPVVRKMEQLPTSAPAWRLKLNAQRTWRVHTSDEISDALKTAASAAQTTANTAIAALNNIAADGWLTASEKKVARTEYDAITNESADLVAKGNNFGLSSLVTAYTNAKNTLDSYISGLSPALTSSSDTAVTRSTWIANWSAYYVAKVNLSDAIGQQAAYYSNLYLSSIGTDVPTILGNSFKRGNTTDDLNCCVVSGPAYGTALVGQDYTHTTNCFLALDNDNTTTAQASQKYMLQTNSGNWFFLVDGSVVSSGSGVSSTTKQLFVTYDGVSIRCFADATLLTNYTTGVAAQQTFYPKWWAKNRNDSIKGLMCTPYSDNNWNSVGGTGRPADYANVASPGDANRVRFSKFEQNLLGWHSQATGATLSNFFTGLDSLGGSFIRADGSFTANSQNVLILNKSTIVGGSRQYRIPVTPGERIFVAAKLEIQAHSASCSWALNGGFKSDADADVGYNTVASGTGSVAYGTVQGGFLTVPSGAAYLSLEFYMLNNSAGAGAYVMAMKEPIVCGAAPNQTVFPAFTPGPSGEFGADVTANVVGPASSDVLYDNAGTTFQIADDLNYKVQTFAGTVTSGVTMSYKVKSGTFNGFTSASGAQTMTVTSGAAAITPTALTTSTATIEITAVYNGRTLPAITTILTKTLAAPPSGGGGGSGDVTSQSSGFTGINTSTFTTITSSLTFTMPTGKTTLRCVVNLTCKYNKNANQIGPWDVEFKVQRGGVDQGTTQHSNPDPSIENDPDFGNVANGGTMQYTLDMTGLTVGVQYTVVIQARVATGTLPTNGYNMTFTGSVALSAP